MKNKSLLLLASIFCLIFIWILACTSKTTPVYPKKVITFADDKANDLALKIRQEVNVEVAEGVALSLWASDSLVNDPVAISIDEKGQIYYAQGSRLSNSEFDIRGHQDWMTASISFQSVEDRRAFIRKTFEPDSDASMTYLKDLNEDGVRDWKDLTVEKEQIWVVSDQSGDGLADQSQLYIEDYHEEISDLANGVEYADGEVYISIGPDLWRTKDVDGDGIADESASISHGFAVHIGFGAHGMSGVTKGPDGRIWWGIGDIGMNVVDKEGKNWKYPNRGVVVRSEPDGSNFEVFAMGVRNTHEFVFDKYGNLITEDNDGDHAGERERLVYLIDGSDTGWRINWQFGKYTDPKNNSYKVWMDEQMSIPRWDGQAAYFLPPIQNYVNGPTGMTYNPGTALSPEWYDHFFISEFRGTPASSPIHAFTMEADGAGFKLGKTQEFVKGLLPTGIDFGPDGALFFGDWITGWNNKKEGRIWKMDVPGQANSSIRLETKNLIQQDFASAQIEILQKHLGHQDMRVRTKAQFQLVKRGNAGFEALKEITAPSNTQLARIHGMWGMAQFARKEVSKSSHFIALLGDSDPEIIAQAAKLIGDTKYKEASALLIELVNHTNPRIQFFATEALGRTEDSKAINAILQMLETNNDKDAWLRMGGIIALGRIDNPAAMVSLANNPSRALRTAAVVALRRMEDAGIKIFLKDKDEYIVAEAARAINDDFSIPDALPALGEVLKEKRFSSEPLLRRAINANLRVGEDENIATLIEFANRLSAPEEMRAEAIAALGTWASPSVLDRVDGRYRGKITREGAGAQKALGNKIATLITDKSSKVQVATIEAAGRLKLESASKYIFQRLQKDKSQDVREAALRILQELESPELENAMELALSDKHKKVRSKALDLLPESNIPEATAVRLFEKIFADGSTQEQQSALASLGKFKSAAAVTALNKMFDKLNSGSLSEKLNLDVVEAVAEQGDPALLSKLKVYNAKVEESDPLNGFYETLAGGDIRRGRNIFYRNEAGQCTRCHAIFEFGGNAGPGLSGVGTRLSKKQILASMIVPSSEFALGYEVATIEMKDGASHTGIISSRTDDVINLKIGKEEIKSLARGEITSYESIPSSMPIIKDKLSKREIRDLVAFLANLTEEHGD
ncbi:MAG: quinoprotein glucose dehydrogenase [Saprospiraceae bacterium]|jgi:quinoprotein glucose dehydrogenase